MSSNVQRKEVFPIFTAPPAIKARKPYVVKLVSSNSKLSTQVKLTAPTVVSGSYRGGERPKGREERKQRQLEMQIEGDDESKTSQWKLEDPHPLHNKRFTGNVESESDGQTQYLLLEFDEKTNVLNILRPVHIHMVPDLSLRAPPPTSLEAAEELSKQREKLVNASLKPQTHALKRLSDLVSAAQSDAPVALRGASAPGTEEVSEEKTRKLAKRKQEIEDSAGRLASKTRGAKSYEWKREENDEELGADDDVLDAYEADAVDAEELKKQEEAEKRRQERAQKAFFESAGRISGLDAELLNADDGIEEVEEEERTKRGRGEEGEGDAEGDGDDDDDDGDDDDDEEFEDDYDDDTGPSQRSTRTKRVKLASTGPSSTPAPSTTSTSAGAASTLMGMVDTAAFNPKAIVVEAFKRAAIARGTQVQSLWIPFSELRQHLAGASTYDEEKKNAVRLHMVVCEFASHSMCV